MLQYFWPQFILASVVSQMILSDTTQTIQTLILQREDIVVVSRSQHPVEKSSVAINMEPVAGPSMGNQAPTSPHITFSWLLTKQEQHILIYVIWNFTSFCTQKFWMLVSWRMALNMVLNTTILVPVLHQIRIINFNQTAP